MLVLPGDSTPLGLWKRIFVVKAQLVTSGERLSNYGGAKIKVKSSARYLKVKLPYTMRKWQDTWVHIESFL